MTLEQLKALLESGAITQEQYDAIAAALEQGEGSGSGAGDNGAGADMETIINRAVDRATNKLGNENKRLKAEIDKFRREKLTEREIQEAELADREATLAERERQIKLLENEAYALKAIKKAGLDKGDETAIELAKFVVADDETAIDERVTAFKTLVDTIVKAEVEATFKKGGRTPDKGNGGAGEGLNPYAKDTWNFTEQMKLESTDPQRAAALKAAAGVM
jgi:hypothetical protein